MSTFLWILYFALFLYVVLLIARFVVELVQSFAHRWRPKGIAVVFIEAVFTVTDPPVKLLRRLIPPLPLGQVRLDLSLMVVLIVLSISMQIVLRLAVRAS